MTRLPEIRREYSLSEVAMMTRAAPARLLGLPDRGHLGPGALADVAVYEDSADRTKMFRSAHLLFKDGELVVREGQVTKLRHGRTLTVRPPVEPAMKRRLADYYDTYHGYSAELLGVPEGTLAAIAGVERVFEEVACRS